MNALKTRLNAHFVACAAVAATAVVAAPENAEAAIHYSGTVNLTITGTIDGVYLNVVTGANSPTAASVPGWDTNPYAGGNNIFSSATAGHVCAWLSVGGTLGNLAAGAVIDGSATWTVGVGTTTAFTTGVAGYYGIRFEDESAGNAVRYGWVRMIKSSGTTVAGTLVDYAWEDSGAGIQAGAGVPAPGAFALIGLAGMVGSRRRRAA